eukprot:scaffold735_cov116-Cylindrotheca_fusiformis.AAC.10
MLVFVAISLTVLAASIGALAPDNPQRPVARRDAIAITASIGTLLTTATTTSKNANAAVDVAVNTDAALSSGTSRESLQDGIDMDKINAARSNAGSPQETITSKTIVPNSNPAPILSIRGGLKGKSAIKIPRVGFSFYKTPPDQAARCTSLALRTGVKHLDLGTQYNSNDEVAKSLKKYLNSGISGLKLEKEEKPELLEVLDTTRSVGAQMAVLTESAGGSQNTLSPALDGSAGRRGRREQLFISHKISNDEQSTDPVAVRRAVKKAIATLGCTYLDMVSIHSPLTDSARRIETYKTLLNLRDAGFVKAVGVCNYGLSPLKEIAAADLELPAVNQLELSPFNRHKDVVDWCDKSGIAIACGAWSKLSSTDGPTEGWDVLSKIAQQKGMTKAQVLVRWSLQKGYICVPRSASASKVERLAIAENSYGGVNRKEGSYVLSAGEMETLDGLDVSYKAGRLGRRDGWNDSDVTGPDWDPTDYS